MLLLEQGCVPWIYLRGPGNCALLRISVTFMFAATIAVGGTTSGHTGVPMHYFSCI